MRASLLPEVSVTDFSLAKMVTELLDCPEADFREKVMKLAKPIESPDEKGDAINVVDASFAWKRSGPPVLRHINMNLKSSHLTMIVGPVACGKSTLLKAILGEVHNLAGSVCVASRDISFCDQTPWLRNTTVQQNILGFANFESYWYSAVIRACALESDLSQLPNGDQTLIGSNGITLSGGQKQRVVSKEIVCPEFGITFWVAGN
jgi:ATP-binding cassette, subfamily C (CFTR/MRP), member 1